MARPCRPAALIPDSLFLSTGTEKALQGDTGVSGMSGNPGGFWGTAGARAALWASSGRLLDEGHRAGFLLALTCISALRASPRPTVPEAPSP